jgi:hypothetical protein
MSDVPAILKSIWHIVIVNEGGDVCARVVMADKRPVAGNLISAGVVACRV